MTTQTSTQPRIFGFWRKSARIQPHVWLIGLWMLTMIAVPILKWTAGVDALHVGVTAGVVTQVVAVVAILARAWGWQRTIWTAIAVATLTWGIEFVGSATGIPFGAYSYTDILSPQLGHVPLVIPLAWMMMLPPAWAVATAIGGDQFRLKFIFLSALAFTAWDLFLDPQMVSWGYWVWHSPGPYFGIPLSNFVGWIVASGLVTAIVRPRDVPVAPLLLIFTITWFLQFGGQLFFWQMAGPALVGGVVMGIFVVLSWRRILDVPESNSPFLTGLAFNASLDKIRPWIPSLGR
jgi:uncharacterized membrane protein